MSKLKTINITSDSAIQSDYLQLDCLDSFKASGTIKPSITTNVVYSDTKKNIEDDYNTSIITTDEYISFADKMNRPNATDNVENLLLGPRSISSVKNILISNFMPDQSGITSFDEFKYFTQYTIIGTAWPNIPATRFTDCTNLTSITFPDTLEQVYGNGNSIGHDLGAFGGCTNLLHVGFNNGLKIIEGHAFEDCINLKVEELPDSITSITESAFHNCKSITLKKLPANLVTLGRLYYVNSSARGVFSGCTGLTEMEFPSTLKSIGIWAFSDCVNLKKLVFNITQPITFWHKAFNNCTGLNIIDISNIEYFLLSSFYDQYSTPLYYCKNLYINHTPTTALNISENFTVDKNVFSNCSCINQINGDGNGFVNAISELWNKGNSLEIINKTGNLHCVSQGGIVTALASMYRGITPTGLSKLYTISSFSGQITDESVRESDLKVLKCSDPSVHDSDHMKVHTNEFGGLDIIYNPNLMYIQINDPVANAIISDKLGDGFGITLDVANLITALGTTNDKISRDNSCFYNSDITTVDWINNFPNLKYGAWLFGKCSKLEEISGLKLLNLSGDCRGMFNETSAKKIDLTGLNTENIQSMGWFFHGCPNIEELDIRDLSTKSNTSFIYFLTVSYNGSHLKSFKVSSKFFDCAVRLNNPLTSFDLKYMGSLWVNVDEITSFIDAMPDLTSLNRKGTVSLPGSTIKVITNNNLTLKAASKGWTIV